MSLLQILVPAGGPTLSGVPLVINRGSQQNPRGDLDLSLDELSFLS